MRTGANSFVQFSAFAVPAILGTAWLLESVAMLFGLVGVFLVLRFCNAIDTEVIRGKRK